jgi:hypothetical protein
MLCGQGRRQDPGLVVSTERQSWMQPAAIMEATSAEPPYLHPPVTTREVWGTPDCASPGTPGSPRSGFARVRRLQRLVSGLPAPL